MDAGWLAIEFGVGFLDKLYVHNIVNPLSAAFWGVRYRGIQTGKVSRAVWRVFLIGSLYKKVNLSSQPSIVFSEPIDSATDISRGFP